MSPQCLTPLRQNLPTQTPHASGAVLPQGQIPLGPSRMVLIYTPEAPRTSPFRQGRYINTRDACPGCNALQVDVFVGLGPGFQPLNTSGGINTPVYIWLVVPIQPTVEIRPIIGPY
jgi:hypothetical protein